MLSLKSIYRRGYPWCCVLLTLLVVWRGGVWQEWAWWPVLLTVMPLWLQVFFRSRLTDAVVTSLTIAGLGLTLLLDAERGLPLGLAFTGWLGLTIYYRWARGEVASYDGQL